MTFGAERVFKTAWFARASKKAHITDKELCAAIRQSCWAKLTTLEAASSRSASARISTAH